MKCAKRIFAFMLAVVVVMGLFGICDTQAVQAADKPGKPKIKAAEKDSGVQIIIGKTNNADGYRIYVKGESGKKYRILDTIQQDGSESRTYTIKNLSKGSYSFRVKAYSISEKGTIWSSNSKAVQAKINKSQTNNKTMEKKAAKEYPKLYELVKKGKLGLTMPDDEQIFFTLGKYDYLVDYFCEYTSGFNSYGISCLIPNETYIYNGKKEDIEWIVLDYKEDEGKALLLSRYIIDRKPYGTEEWRDGPYAKNSTWSNSSIRKWLNEEFYEGAFNKSQQKLIIKSKLKNQDTNSDSASVTLREYETEDWVFLLSSYEIWELEDNNDEISDEFFITSFYNGKASVWALRDIHHWYNTFRKYWDTNCSTMNGEDGYLGGASAWTHGIRPAIWIDLNP